MGFPISDEEGERIRSMIEAGPELVVAAAIRTAGVIVMAERPGRHGDCINVLHGRGFAYSDQGFVTSHGRFVDRKEAAEVVQRAGQGSPSPRITTGHLFSEDLWNEPPSITHETQAGLSLT